MRDTIEEAWNQDRNKIQENMSSFRPSEQRGKEAFACVDHVGVEDCYVAVETEDDSQDYHCSLGDLVAGVEEVGEEHYVEVRQVVDPFRIDVGEHDDEELEQTKRKVDDVHIGEDNEQVAEPAPQAGSGENVD